LARFRETTRTETTKMDLVKITLQQVFEAPACHVIMCTQFSRLSREVEAIVEADYPDVTVYRADGTTCKTVESLIRSWKAHDRSVVLMKAHHPHCLAFAAQCTDFVLLDGSQDMRVAMGVWRSGHAHIWYPTVLLDTPGLESPDLVHMVGRSPSLEFPSPCFLMTASELHDVQTMRLDQLCEAKQVKALSGEGRELLHVHMFQPIVNVVKELFPLLWIASKRSVRVKDLAEVQRYLVDITDLNERNRMGTAWLLQCLLNSTAMQCIRIMHSLVCYILSNNTVYVVATTPPLQNVDDFCALFPMHVQFKFCFDDLVAAPPLNMDSVLDCHEVFLDESLELMHHFANHGVEYLCDTV
jgi:hypothetical protein